jgi:PII-like signaling protein
MRVLDGEQVLARIVVGESDRWHHQPLWTALLERLRREGFAGATVLRGIGGFGARSVLHTTLLERLSQELLPLIDEMVPEGLVTMEKVRVVKYAAGARPLDAKR